ncbi:putative membrane transport protein [Helianthus anomalus]
MIYIDLNCKSQRIWRLIVTYHRNNGSAAYLVAIFGILVVKGAIYFSLAHVDPLYLFVLILHYALPPARNIGSITQLFGAGETECSVIMLWTYGLASFSLTFRSMFFMWFVA